MVRPHLSPAINVCRVVLNYQIPGGIAQNVYHVYKSAGWDLDSLASCASTILDWESGRAVNNRSSQVGLLIAHLSDLTSMDSAFYAVSPSTFQTGKLSANILPNNVTLALHATTGIRGTGRQGRTYWIGLAEEQTDGSAMIPGALDAILADLANLRTNIQDNNAAELVVLHRTRDGVDLNPAQTSSILNWSALDLTTDSQVNRLPGRSRPNHRP